LAACRRKLRADSGAHRLGHSPTERIRRRGKCEREIGSVLFDQATYDAENDVLYLSVGIPEAGEGEATPEGHVIRYSPGTDRVVGITLLSPRRILERDGHLVVGMPEVVETSAQELADALAAA
jgi:hypothetical protein